MNRIQSAVLGLGLLWAASVQAAAPIEVLVLGSYHMGNPGRDIHNSKADDVLTPQRQRDLQAIRDGLARFKPMRIAVEQGADAEPGNALPAYRDYLSGKVKNPRNEIVQIGFRLAQQLGHAQVYGIDADGDFPYEPVKAYAKANGQEQRFADAHAEVAREVGDFEKRQATSSIGQLLRVMNQPDQIATMHGWYMQLMHYGNGAEQPGAKLASAWYARNLQICARLAQVAQPGDRIVVVYGAGHLHLLRQCVKEIPGWILIEANDYLPG